MKSRLTISFVILLITCTVFMTGCATVEPQKPQEAIFFPQAPEEARVQYLTSISSSEDIQGKKAAFQKFILGEEPSKSIIKPYGIKVKDGKIYVCDTVVNAVVILDLDKNTFDYLSPSTKGRLSKPVNLEVTSDGTIYVADTRRGQVVVLEQSGQFITAIGDKSELKPADVAVTGERVYVSDLKSHSVRVYQRRDNSFLYTIPKEGQTEEAQLFSPTNIDLDASGNIYVSDTGGFNVKKFTLDGTWLKTIGTIGDAPGQFARPKGIAVDKENNVYIADAAFENIQLFNEDGELLLFFPETDNPARLVLPAGLAIDYEHLDYFSKYVDQAYNLKYLIFVVSQYGDRKISVFGFIEKK